MKLTQFALAAIIVLLAVAGYLTIKSDIDGRLADQNAFNEKLLSRVEDLAKKQAAPAPMVVPSVAPAPVPSVQTPAAAPPRDPQAMEALAAAAAIPPDAPLAAEDDPRMLEDERGVLNLGADNRVATESLDLPAPGENQALTRVQQRIAALPAIARVKDYAAKEGMIVLDRGTNANLQAGDSFALRRGSAVIGRIRLSETIQDTESIADVVPGSMPVGMLPEATDDVIQFEQ